MDKYLFITKNRNGSITIRDTVTETKLTYYFTTESAAIKKHRENTNTRNKHFKKIYL